MEEVCCDLINKMYIFCLLNVFLQCCDFKCKMLIGAILFQFFTALDVETTRVEHGWLQIVTLSMIKGAMTTNNYGDATWNNEDGTYVDPK